MSALIQDMQSQNKEFSKLYNGLYRLLLGFALHAHHIQRYHCSVNTLVCHELISFSLSDVDTLDECTFNREMTKSILMGIKVDMFRVLQMQILSNSCLVLVYLLYNTVFSTSFTSNQMVHLGTFLKLPKNVHFHLLGPSTLMS